MGSPVVLFSEAAAIDALRAFVVACCPEVPTTRVFRQRPTVGPDQQGVAVLLAPTTTLPVDASWLGESSTAAQRQRWRFTVQTAAAGQWRLVVLGQNSDYVADPADTTADIATGLALAVGTLGLPVAASSDGAAVEVLADVAGASLGVTASTPPGGAGALVVADDNRRVAFYNWGMWTCRVAFQDVTSDAAGAQPGGRPPGGWSSPLCERFRRMIAAPSLPVTNGLAYPFRRDQLQAAGLNYKATRGPFVGDRAVDMGWLRVCAVDVQFQVAVGLLHDVPSLDTIGFQAPVVIGDP